LTFGLSLEQNFQIEFEVNCFILKKDLRLLVETVLDGFVKNVKKKNIVKK